MAETSPHIVKINSRVGRVSASLTLALTAKAKALRAQGVDVIGFGAGEPDFDTPDVIKRRAIRDIEAGVTRYTPVSGTPELKQAVCDKLRRDNGIDYTPDQVIISCGAKHTLYNIFQTMLDPGDEVIVPEPYWLSYPEQIQLAGGEIVTLSTGAAASYKITPDQLAAAITDRTVAFLFNSPCNPTGMIYSPDEIRALAAVLADHPKVTIISDEIYEKLVYAGAEHLSFAAVSPQMHARTITVNGMSKSYAMTGWRVGYCAGPKEFIAAMGRLQSHSTSNPTAFCQSASIVALGETDAEVERMRLAFDERRRDMFGRLNAIEGINCPEPRGAFYVFPDVSALYAKAGVDGSIALCERLLDEAKIACVPGAPFGDDNSMRMSYALSPDSIAEGLNRLEKFVADLG